MGKKDKNKKKISGIEKTALKTEKKLSAKKKKELANLGEEDIAKLVHKIEKEGTCREKVVETVVTQPSRRVNFSLTAHPLKDELIMFGGEFCDGKKTEVYKDMFLYNIAKNEWTLVEAPNAPPPRCGHQAVSLPSNRGELWVFGGEFSSPSESQFYHYRDLWVFHIGDKKWEKITSPGGPSVRSGHRMLHLKKRLFIFGGFHDNLRDYQYFNDVHCFDMSSYTWTKLEISGIPPAPRSGCIALPTQENRILVYGGYSKERIKKDVDKGHVHSDMFVLRPEKNDETGLKWKWSSVKQSGAMPSPRCSSSAVLVNPNLAYIFGGVHDEVDDEETLQGVFFNDLLGLNLEDLRWRNVQLSHVSNNKNKPRRRKKEAGKTNEDDEAIEEPMETVETTSTTTTDDDGIFTVTVGPAMGASSTSAMSSGANSAEKNIFWPRARINPGLVVKNHVLYLYGGMFETEDAQYTLNDFYSLDCRKLEEWRIIVKDDMTSHIWLDSSSESDDDDSSDSESSDSDAMEVDD